MTIETIKVPDLGGADSVEVIEVCVAVGDVIEVDDSIVVLESDKASMEVPSPKAGTVSSIAVKEGDTLTEGAVLLELEIERGETGDSEPAQAVSEQNETPQSGQDNDSQPASQPGSKSESKPESQPTASSQTVPVAVPDLGGPDEVTVIEVCVAEGDEVAEGDSLVVLESDKASMEVPSPQAGTVVAIAISEGQQAAPGMEILQLKVQGTAAPENAAAAPAKEKSEPSAPESEPSAGKSEPSAGKSEPSASQSQPAGATPSSQREIPTPSFASTELDGKPGAAETGDSTRSLYAGPAVRKLAREMGIPLEKVKASGPRNRIVKDDLKSYVKTALTESVAAPSGTGIPPVPAVDFEKFGAVTVEPLSKIHKVTLESMHRSWLNVPHVTQFDDVDITDLEDFRSSLKPEAEKRGVKVTPMAFLLKACAKALLEHPKFNASLHPDGESIVYKRYVHIGMAVDTPAGLVVPVIRDVDTKSIWELAAESAELAGKAKNRKLSPAEMQGGCFTISSLGSMGGQGFTPIVNTPEVAILGVSRLTVKPVWNGTEFVPRKMLPLSLSYDHRAINGGDTGRFFTYLNELLSDIRRLAL